MDQDTVTPRKSARTKQKPSKFEDFLEVSRRRRVSEFESEEELSSDDNVSSEQGRQKPMALFSKDDVEGQDMFAFKSRHTKHDLQNKVKSVVGNSPVGKSPLRTPRKSLKGTPRMKMVEATPKIVKDIMKRRLKKQVERESDEDNSDFSGSSSDFVPEVEGDFESSAASESEEESEPVPVTKKRNARNTNTKDTRKSAKDSEYIVTPDNYFMMNSNKKITTSDHTLERLKNFTLNDNSDVGKQFDLSEEHKQKVNELNKSYENLFDRWHYVLSENFNIILYGVGSKRSILHTFQTKKLKDFPCIVVNGFFPSLTLKNILESIVIDLLECTHVPANISDAVNLMDAELTEYNVELFLIIHNIDGPMLRSSKTQAALASISNIRNIHTIATIDHINAPLLWDHSKLSKFNFTWWDVTTFQPYIEETSYENSLLTHRAGALQISSLKSVYLSLTSNAKGIFNIIIQYQLDNCKQTNYQGLPFRDLYSKSREQFLVSSDVALRAQLTEFLDHKLVKIKRTYDGAENLLIPIDNSLLQQFLEHQC